MAALTSWVLEAASGLPEPVAVMLVAMVPIAELRLAIPFAIAPHAVGGLGMAPAEAFLFAVVGNLIPVPVLLRLLEPVSSWLRRFRSWERFFDWLFERTRQRSEARYERYGLLALCMFVAIPLPFTGAWTGTVVASLFNVSFFKALGAIALGVLIAGVLLTLLSTGVLSVAASGANVCV
ncbi:MAG: COG2426 family protein [Methermicoccaceae archaeon]